MSGDEDGADEIPLALPKRAAGTVCIQFGPGISSKAPAEQSPHPPADLQLTNYIESMNYNMQYMIYNT